MLGFNQLLSGFQKKGRGLTEEEFYAVRGFIVSAAASPAFVRRLAADHLSGRRDHTLRLWQLVVFEKWHQQYVDTAHGTGFPLSAPSIPLEPAVSAR